MKMLIDKEFAEIIPPLTTEEYEQLEANILANGVVINPLITWNGIIVDGHNRYRILQNHPEIPFQVHEKEFSDRYEVIAWICKNQLGRRNLTPAQRKYLIGKQYEAEKARLGNEPGISQLRSENGRFTVSGQNVPPRTSDRTSQRIANEIGTNERYVRRAEEFARGIDAAEEVIPGILLDAWDGAFDSLRAETISAMCEFVDLYEGEYDRKRMIRRFRGYDPINIFRQGRAMGDNMPGYRKYLYQVWAMYNGSSVKTALPMKF